MFRGTVVSLTLLLKQFSSVGHCENCVFMYNLASFIVIKQQTKKKPLVTKLLTGYSYGRGRRCEINYDQFLSFGQVIPKGIHRQHDSGERRWFSKKPILDHNLIVPIIWGHSLSVVFARLVKSCLWIVVSVAINKESQALVCLAFNKCFSLTAYLAELSDVGASSVQSPFSGDRGGVPQMQCLFAYRIAYAGGIVKN